MLINALFFRQRRALTAGASRAEVCPPALLAELGESRWPRVQARVRTWLQAPALTALAGDNALARAKRDFTEQLADLRSAQSRGLRLEIGDAPSMRELWHLRAAVFDAVSRTHDQCEAERRLAALNQHFPTRAPRSAFAPLA